MCVREGFEVNVTLHHHIEFGYTPEFYHNININNTNISYYYQA